MEILHKLVNFKDWCPKCEHGKKHAWEDPCNFCLEEGGNVQTEKPVMYKEKDK